MKEVNFDEKVVVERDGEKLDCDILFKFNAISPDTLEERVFVGYTDNEIVDDKKNLYVSSKSKDGSELKDVSDKEMVLVKKALREISRGVQNGR